MRGLKFTKSDVEEATLDWLKNFGWRVTYGPDIVPDMSSAGRNYYVEIILSTLLRDRLSGSTQTSCYSSGQRIRQADSAGRAVAVSPQPSISWS